MQLQCMDRPDLCETSRESGLSYHIRDFVPYFMRRIIMKTDVKLTSLSKTAG